MTFQQNILKAIEEAGETAPITTTRASIPYLSSNSPAEVAKVVDAIIKAMKDDDYNTIAEEFAESASKITDVLAILKHGAHYVQYLGYMASPEQKGDRFKELFQQVADGVISPEEAVVKVRGVKTAVQKIPETSSGSCHY